MGATAFAAVMIIGSPTSPAGADELRSSDQESPPLSLIADTPGGEPSIPALQRLDADESILSQTRADCTRKAQAARASALIAVSTCVSIEPKLNPEPLPQKQARALAVTLPQCSQSASPNTGWWAESRRGACTHRQFEITVTQVPSGAVVGTANIHATMDMTSATSAPTWTSNIYLWVWSVTGSGMPQNATGKLFGCAGCASTSSFAPASFDGWNGTGSFSKTGLATGAVQTGLGGNWQVSLGSTAWSNGAVTVPLNLASYRCDNATPGKGPGCVFSSILGVAGFSQTTNPGFVQHVYQAQLSGLPGQLGSGTYLTRLTDSGLVSKNGTKACPSSSALPRPPGLQCDEYPFRSTYQGAFTGAGGIARSHQGCNMPDPVGSGPTGWSRCFIPSGQNSSAGGLLGGFYGNSRIIDGEAYQVGYLP